MALDALGWKAPCSELKGPECGSSGGMPGMVGGYEGKKFECLMNGLSNLGVYLSNWQSLFLQLML